MNRKLSPLAIAIVLALSAAPAFAQEHAPAPAPAGTQVANTLDTVIVTGTRVSDRTVAESQSPIDIITPEALLATGTTELATALARALPSLNFPRPAVTDGTSAIRPAQLRGLSPDQVLILVNGKRRHSSALLNVNGSIGRGSSAVDLNAIPVAAIARVEVLRDGASAQYGSDAIAGVVNLVLKGSEKGGSLALDLGQYSAGDGKQYQLSGDTGLGFAGDRGFVHVAGQLTQQNETNRAGAYVGTPGVTPTPNTGNNPGLGETAFVYGDPKVDAAAISANAGFAFNDHIDAYATVTASNRDITSYAFYRSPNHSGQGALLAQFYPDGYVPEIAMLAQDRSLVAGVKGNTDSGWNWDLSYNYGYNHLAFHTQNSINYSLGVASPTRVHEGALEYTHNNVKADVTKTLDWSLAYPVTLSFGTEYRSEKWNQSPGAADSYSGSGAQGFGGFTPQNAGQHDRDSYAVYAGLEADLTEKFSAGLAGRYEDYSDFGSETSGKLSARYAFTDQVALRGTVASGFRAPALSQQYYQAVTTNFNNGVAFESGTFPVGSAAAQALGAEPLQAETSLSYSLGLVLQPLDRLYITLDAYQISIDDRIVLSSNIPLNNNPAAQALLASLGITNVTSARYFTNAIDTRTRGIDLVGSYSIPLSASTLNLTAGYNYNKTEVTRVAPNPPQLDALGANLRRLGRDEQGRIEEGFPREKLNLNAAWNLQNWDLNLAATRYGEFTTRYGETASALRAVDQTYDAKWILDASVSFRPSSNWTLTLGADNLLDEYPDRTSAFTNTEGQFPYSSQSPFGFNGSYVYGRVSYKWQ